MTLSHALFSFFADKKLQAAVAVIVVDFILGVCAALKLGTFRLSYFGDFGRNDILFKLVPWLAVYIGAEYAGHQQIVIPGIDLGVIAGAVYVAMLASWAGSILTSLAELGFNTADRAKAALSSKYGNLPAWAAAPENASPPKD